LKKSHSTLPRGAGTEEGAYGIFVAQEGGRVDKLGSGLGRWRWNHPQEKKLEKSLIRSIE